MEVKSSLLHSRKDGSAVLILVDENYEIHQLSGELETMRLLLQDVDLPNFIWRHASDSGVYQAGTAGYEGRYGGNGLALIDQYRKKKAS